MHPSTTPPEKTQQNPSKPFSSFLCKLIFVSIFIALLPFLPFLPSSQNPEFSNNSLVARSYELLRLLLVGIAISYGLFSRRNSDPDVGKENQLKTDTPQSYVSKILNVSSVFDDEEVESPKGFDFVDEPKNQTWNYSQHCREKPVAMVAEGSVDGANGSAKPMFLPVRSLKPFDPSYESIETSSSPTSNQKDEVGTNGKIGGKEAAVLPSPIPWRSRSGKMEVKEESPPPHSLPSSASNKEVGLSKAQSFKSPSPKRLSASPSLSQEIRGKFNEDSGKQKSFHKPPPPPPLPPPLNYASHFISDKRDTRKSFKDELGDLSKRGRREFSSDSFNSEKVSYMERSVRTVSSKEAQGLPSLPRNQSKKRNEFMEKMIIHSDTESDNDSDQSSDVQEASNSTSTEAGPQENEVDKKADEFIAKFREQIRLQRIASIKKSSGQETTRSSK